jgi:hypothetical protein
MDKSPNYPLLVAGRWQFDEFGFAEYLKGDCFLIDLGPFPHNPTDEETDQAFEYLQKCRLDYLDLGELEWVFDLDKAAGHFPELRAEGLSSQIKHPAAFEIFTRPTATRWLSGRTETSDASYFLRICFNFKDVGKTETNANPDTPPDWNPPQIIS